MNDTKSKLASVAENAANISIAIVAIVGAVVLSRAICFVLIHLRRPM